MYKEIFYREDVNILDTLTIEAWYYLERYDKLISEMIPLSSYELYVESISDPVVQKKEKSNNEKQEQSDNILMKFFNTIKTLITTLISSISNFVSLTFMKPDERERYEKMKAINENDPRLKGKTFTVADFRKLEKEYQGMENRLLNGISNLKKGTIGNIKEIIDEVKSFVKRDISGATAVVTPSIAMKIASSNIEAAKAIQKSLANDKNYMAFLEKELGKREAKKFKKGIDHAVNRDNSYLSHAYMALYELKHGRARELSEAWAQIYDQFNKILGLKGGFIDRVKALFSNSDIVSRGVKNDAVRGTVVNAVKAKKEGEKKAKKEVRDEAKRQKLGGKEREQNTGRYAPIRTFVNGEDKKNDKD